ncbi:glycosyltransferase [Skermania sp. ID1734]|uniref:glycosyltransferase n=1 Tax=Skermania sp. ID1734 TaxID=2597516 RepID=UPI00351BC1DE
MQARLGTAVTINITAHREGYLLHKSLRAVESGANLARCKGVKGLQLNIHLDDSDELTRTVAMNFVRNHPEFHIFENCFKSPAVSRNFLIEMSDGKYIQFVDGDDLFTANFFYAAYECAERHEIPAVFSANYVIDFNRNVRHEIVKICTTTDEPLRRMNLVAENPYVSQNLVHGAIYREIHYDRTTHGYGFEDWHWNTKVLAAGYEFIVVPETAFYYRRGKANSVLVEHQGKALMPSPLFNPVHFSQLADSVGVLPTGSDHDDGYADASREGLPLETGGEGNGRLPLASRLAIGLQRFAGHDRLAYRTARAIYRSAKLARTEARAGERESALDQTAELPIVRQISDQLLEHWRELALIEPILSPTTSVLESAQIIEPPTCRPSTLAYANFCKRFNDTIDDIIVVSRFEPSGADLSTIELVEALTSVGRRVAVIATGRPRWGERTRDLPNSELIECYEFFPAIDDTEMEVLLERITLNFEIKTLTIIDSPLGYSFIDKHGSVLQGKLRVLMHSYAMPVDGCGLQWEAFSRFPGALQYIDHIVTDSNFHAMQIVKTYGYIGEITKAPLQMPHTIQRKISGVTGRVLFAHRIANEKQSTDAIAIANEVANFGVHLDIWGPKDEENCCRVRFDELAASSSNVRYLGPFDGLHSVDLENYDLLLLTSLCDRVLQLCREAVCANLFIVCPDMVDLAEIVEHGVNGYVVKDPGDVAMYASAIESFYSTTELQDLSKRWDGTREVREFHSRPIYTREIGKIYQKP